MSSLTVGPANEAEAAACLALLPEVREAAAEVLVARLDGRLAGAAAVIWQSWATPGGFPLRVHVLPSHRRQGVGRRLVAAAADLAQGEIAGLWSLEPEAVDSDAAAFLVACGFTLARRQHYFQAAVATLHEVIAPLVQRLRDRGRVPDGARVVELADSPMNEVSWLVANEFGGGPFRALNGLRQRAQRAEGSADDRSLVVLQGDKVAAVMLIRDEDRVAVVDARVVAPDARGDWANAVLLDASLGHCRARGVEEFRFHCDDHVSDTLSLARRAAAREVATKGLFYYALSAT